MLGLSRAGLAEALGAVGVAEGQRKMRVAQLWHWIYVRGATDFAAMSNVSKDLRTSLAEAYVIGRPEIVTEQVSEDARASGCFRFPPRGAGRPVEVETVYIPEEGRGTLCLSSQVGCTLSCTFCHTGTQKLVRNLTAERSSAKSCSPATASATIPASWRERAPRPVPSTGRLVSNVVMMGMGDRSIISTMSGTRLPSSATARASACRSAASRSSTSGVVPMIERAGAEMGVMLAISLHAVTDEIRDKLVPINKKYPLAELLAACRAYPGLSNARRITFEYVMLKGRQRFARRRARPSEAPLRHPGEINLHPVQPVAGHRL